MKDAFAVATAGDASRNKVKRNTMRFGGALALLAAAAIASAANSSGTPEDRLSSMGRLAKQQIEAVTKGFGVQSSPCFNQPDCDDAQFGPALTQSETAIAVDSSGQHIVIGFNDFRGLIVPPSQPISLSGFMYSDDGGATFIDGGQLPAGPTTIVGGRLFPQIFGDPDVKYLGGCNFVYVSLMVKGFGPTGLVQTLAIHRSTDCGHTWSGPFEVPPATNPNGKVDVNGDAVDAADKELADVDPDTSRYMVCWSNFTPSAVGGIEISCTYSDNVLAPIPVFSPRAVVAAALPDGQGSAVRFAGNGSPNVYVAWARFPGSLNGYANNVGFARSTDNGVTWSAPRNLTADFLTMDYVLGNDRVNTHPSLAVDKSAGAYSGNVYTVYSNNNSRDGADVAFQKSTDGGLTFSAPIFLNARPGADRAQWFPYVTVDRTTGRVWVFYYDQGVAASGDLTEITYLHSDDGGTTWSKPVPLTTRAFKAGWGNDTSQPNLGDYNQAVAQSGTLYAAYAATTPVGFADGQPAGQLPTPDVFFAKVSSGATKPPLHTGPVTFTETGGDGNIDPGDQVRLKIPLANYVTNPLNAMTVGGIFATLATTTPGVAVVQAGSAYPDLAAGASAVNGSDFVLQIAPTFVPGTPIDLSLAIGSAQGSTTAALTQQTGTPVYVTLLNETFDGVAPGSLPPGWAAAHGAGANIIPWTTTSSFATPVCGGSNKAFHQNATDGPAGGSPSRWERLLSPPVNVPSNAQYVTLDFDVCYDTEDDPVLPILAYDGFFLRITDLTPGRTLRSVLAEAFEEEFTTDGFQHYPKHLPRSNDPNYFEDMSAWAGFSGGIQHVHMKLPGMAGSRAQLRFEYTQDGSSTCANVRPGHSCGVTIDNVVLRSVVSIAPLSVNLEVRQSLSRDPVTNEIVANITVTNTGTGTAAGVQLTSVLLGSTPATTALPNLGNITAGGSATGAVRFPGSAGTTGAPGVLRVVGSYAGGNFSSSLRVILP
jgi:hypothetical protein